MESILEYAGRTFVAIILSISSFFSLSQPIATSTATSTPPSPIDQAAATTTVTPANEPVVAKKPGSAAVAPKPTAAPEPTPAPARTPTPVPAPAPIPAPKTDIIAPVSLPPEIASGTVTTTASTTDGQTAITFDEINYRTRLAVVNILCSTNGGVLNPITGSGIIIDDRGVILTNAHIGQYFLFATQLPPGTVQCSIRTGDPAVPTYRAIPLYVSSRWVMNNSLNLKLNEAKGTGEDDFALLLINAPINAQMTLPPKFPFITFDIEEQDLAGQQVLVSGYAAGFLGGEAIQRALYNSSALAFVHETLSYTGITYDYIEINGSVVAQRGASGGAVVSNKGYLVGLISTVTGEKQTSDRYLGAAAVSHINQSLLKQTGADLFGWLEGDVASKAQQFNELVAPSLVETLLAPFSTSTPAQ